MSNTNDSKPNSRPVTQEPQVIKERMINGEVAKCNFCNTFESNAVGVMCAHVNGKHYSLAGSEGWCKYVTMTGKTAPIDNTAPVQTLTAEQMINDLNTCRLGMYDRDFFYSLMSQQYERGYLSEKQMASLSKMHTRYRKQITANKAASVMNRNIEGVSA